MAAITVAVPVFNGERQIGESLECICGQSFADLEIIVGDNASTDGTQSIVERFAANDSRIKYIVRPDNIGSMPNFIDLLDRATSPLFLWRAHDDISSRDYIALLHEALSLTPSAILAAPTTITTSDSRADTRVSRPATFASTSEAGQIVRMMFGSHAGWFYGLWRTEALRLIVHKVWKAFPYPWASDHLALYPAILDRSVVAVPNAEFHQRISRKIYTPAKGTKPSVATMVRMRNEFGTACDDFIEERNFRFPTKQIIKGATRVYVGKRVYRLGTLLGAIIKHGLK